MPASIQRSNRPMQSIPSTAPRSQTRAYNKPTPPAVAVAAAAPAIQLEKIALPTTLPERFALALQSQAMPWVQGEAVVRGLYAEDCQFRDPVVRFNDREAFIKYLKFMDDWGTVPRVDITESHMEGKVGFAKGSLYYQPMKGPTMRADFTTRMEFNDAGLIVKHEDKWNVLGTLISTLMGRGKLPA